MKEEIKVWAVCIILSIIINLFLIHVYMQYGRPAIQKAVENFTQFIIDNQSKKSK